MHPANAIDLLRTNPLDRAAAGFLQRRQRAGELVRVRHGVYVERSAWDVLDRRSQYLVRMRAVIPLLRPGAVFVLDSAAAVHGCPRLGSWPDRVHVTVPGLDHDLHRVGLTVHSGGAVRTDRSFQGVRVADLAHTAVETARRGSLAGAVVALDHALRSGVEPRVLEELAAGVGPWGSVRLEQALAICDVRHESVGESYLAVRAAELGCPDMEPQHEFRFADGRVARVDFWLPREGIVVEFDGRQKYEDPAMLHGRTPEDTAWDEKRREDRVRARPEVNGFVRVYWEHVQHPERLRALFREHGVPCR